MNLNRSVSAAVWHDSLFLSSIWSLSLKSPYAWKMKFRPVYFMYLLITKMPSMTSGYWVPIKITLVIRLCLCGWTIWWSSWNLIVEQLAMSTRNITLEWSSIDSEARGHTNSLHPQLDHCLYLLSNCKSWSALRSACAEICWKAKHCPHCLWMALKHEGRVETDW